MKSSSGEYSASRKICQPLVEKVIGQSMSYPFEVWEAQYVARDEVKKFRRQEQSDEYEKLLTSVPNSFHKPLKLAQEKGASSWLTALPLEEYGFSLHKSAFRNAVALRYNWSLEQVPTSCSCGSSFSIEHALSCSKGGYPSIRHNEIRDLTANLVSEVCSNVSVEPMLQSITGETFHRASANVQKEQGWT